VLAGLRVGILHFSNIVHTTELLLGPHTLYRLCNEAIRMVSEARQACLLQADCPDKTDMRGAFGDQSSSNSRV
jgi:hypothetical protein